MNEPLVTIIITTYNRPYMLPVAIQSVIDQTYGGWELIVVNDAGEDVSGIIDEFSNDNPDIQIKYINKEKNAGLGAARNTGLENANGQYVNFLDDDDRFYPFHIQILVEYLQKNHAEIAYTDAVCEVYNFQNKQLIDVRKVIPYSLDYNHDTLLFQNITPVLCVMYELNDITKSLRFNEQARVYEDWLMWLEITKHFDMHHIAIPTCLYTFRNDGSTMSSTREEFTTMLPDIFKENWGRARNKVYVAQAMNAILSQRKLPPMFRIDK